MNVTSWSHINVSCYMINNIILSNLSVQIDTNYGHVEQKNILKDWQFLETKPIFYTTRWEGEILINFSFSHILPSSKFSFNG